MDRIITADHLAEILAGLPDRVPSVSCRCQIEFTAWEVVMHIWVYEGKVANKELGL